MVRKPGVIIDFRYRNILISVWFRKFLQLIPWFGGT